MANSLDLVINLVVQNQDATKKLTDQLQQLSQVRIPPLVVPIGDTSGIDKLQQKLSDFETQLGKIPPVEIPIGGFIGLDRIQQKLNDQLSKLGQIKVPPVEVPIGDLAGIYNLQQKLAELRSQANKIPPIEVPIGDTSGINKLKEELADLAAKSTTFPPIDIPVRTDGYKEVLADTVRLAERLGLSAAESRKLQQSLNLPTDKIEFALAKLQQFERVKLPIEEQFRSLNKELEISQEQFDKLKNVKIHPQGTEDTNSGLSKVFETASKVSFGFNNISQSVQAMEGAARPAYEYLIGANERLNQSILQSAASITATSSVSGADGEKLKNLESIRALGPKLKDTIREVEVATQSLVGVTSQQTSEVFNTILRNTGALNGQLKEATGSAQKFKDPLDGAAKLAPGLVATLGTLGLPLSEAAMEINRLLKGEIDQNAKIAKSLGITRQMVEQWKAQGTLVDQLTKRFDPFLKANAEAARSVGGITSNIQDIFQIMGREAGKPLTAGFVTSLQAVYEVLQKITPTVQQVFTDIVAQAVTTMTKVADAVAPTFQGIGTAISAIAPVIANNFLSLLRIIGNIAETLKPVFSLAGTAIASIGTRLAILGQVAITLTETLANAFTSLVGGALTLLSPLLDIIAKGLEASANALAAISADPIGALVLQAVLFTAIIGPTVLTVLELGAAFVALAGTVGGLDAIAVILVEMFPLLGTAVAAVFNLIEAFKLAKIAGLEAFAEGGISAAISAVFPKLAGLVAAIGKLGPAFKALGPIAMEAIGTIATAFAEGGLSGVFSALGTKVIPAVIQGFKDLAVSAGALDLALAPILAILVPLLAIGGVIAFTLVMKGKKDLEDTQQELDDLGKITNDISDNALKNAGKLKKLAEAAASGGLSDKQKQESKDLIFGTKQQIKLIDDQIDVTKKLKQEQAGKGADTEQLATFDKQVEQLETAKKSASKYADAVTIASQAVADLGTTTEQLAEKVKAAKGIIDSGVGDPTKFKESAKLLGDLIHKQVELGVISADEGAKTLAKLQNNTKLDYEAQLAAKEAIVKLYQSRFAKIDELKSTGQLSNGDAEKELEGVRSNTELQLKVRVDAGKKLNAVRKELADAELSEIGAQTAEIAAKKAQGSIGEDEAAKETTATKVAESRIRIEQQQKELANELNPEARRKLEGEVRKSEAEITKIESEERDRRNAERLKEFDEKAKIIQGGLDKGRITEDQFNAQKKSLDVARSAEEIQQLNDKFARLNITDKAGREAVQAQIAEAESKQEANKKQANERELATLQESVSKTTELVRNAETSKKLEVEKAIADGVKTRADGDAEIAKIAIEGAEKVVAAEKSKLDKLKSFPPFLNPKENEALQHQIRDQENKTSELQLGLIQKRLAAERSALEERKKLIDEEYNRKNQATKNVDLDNQLELEKAVLNKTITRSEADNKMAQSAKDRIDSEYAAEKDKYDKLSNLKPLSNPEEERRRQDSLRAEEEKLKNAELAGVKKAQEVRRSNEEVEKKSANDRKEEAERTQKNAEEAAKGVLDEIVAANRAADLEINRSKALRLEASKALEFNALAKVGFETEKIAREGAARELKIEQEALETLYKMKVGQANELAKSLQDNEISGPAAIEAVAQLQKEVSDLNLKRIDLEKKALEQLRAEKIRQIEIELSASTQPLQKKIDLLTQQKTLIEQQNALIGAQDRLESASFNLAKQRSSFAIEDAKAAGGEAAAKGLEADAAREQLKFTRLQNASKLESITLGLEQKAIDTDMARLQAQIALLQSQANLEKAISEGKSKIQIDALNREVALRTQQVDLTAKAAANQAIIGGKDLAAAKIEGQIALERDQRGLDKATGTKTSTLNTGYNPGATSTPFESSRSIQVAPLPPPKPVEKEEKGSAKFTFEPVEIIGKASDAVAKGGESFSKSLEKAVGAIDQFSAKLTTGKTTPIPTATGIAIPARFAGGQIGAGELFSGGELGPELAQHSDGSYQMLLSPGIYSLDRSAQIIPAHQTQQILRDSPMMTSTNSSTTVTTDNTDLLHELRMLRSVVTNRRPQMNVPVSFAAPSSDGADRSMAALSRMLIRSGI